MEYRDRSLQSGGGICFHDVLGQGPPEHRADGLSTALGFAFDPIVGNRSNSSRMFFAPDIVSMSMQDRRECPVQATLISFAVRKRPVTLRRTYSAISFSIVIREATAAASPLRQRSSHGPARAALVSSFARSRAFSRPTSDRAPATPVAPFQSRGLGEVPGLYATRRYPYRQPDAR